MSRPHAEQGYEGLALHDFLPLAFEATPVTDPSELEHYNQETARALQALALFEEAPRDVGKEANIKGSDPELLHLEAKVDVLLSLVTRLVSQQAAMPKRQNLVLRADAVEWAGSGAEQLVTGDGGVIVLYPNPMLPMPFRLPARLAGTVDRGGTRWRIARFEMLAPLVSVGLEKLVFRRHRRQVAIAKATDVFSKTGVHRAPGF